MICKAKEFRDKYPNYSFTYIGYSVAPKELREQYASLLKDVKYNATWEGEEETHICNCCEDIIYSRTHR